MSNYDEYNDDNIYNDPKKWGLKPLVDQDIAGAWEFSIFAVWYKPDKKGLYYAIDSGCSCPTPFSNYTKLEDLMFSNRRGEIMAAIDSWKKNYYYNDKDERTDVSRLKRKIRDFLNKNSI